MSHGGNRPGAGRHTNASKGLPIQIKKSVSISLEAHQIVLDNQKDGEPYSQVVDRLLRRSEMNIKEHHTSDGYGIYLREVDADYDQEPGFVVVYCKECFPPHHTEFFRTRAEAEQAFNNKKS